MRMFSAALAAGALTVFAALPAVAAEDFTVEAHEEDATADVLEFEDTATESEAEVTGQFDGIVLAFGAAVILGGLGLAFSGMSGLKPSHDDHH